MELSVEQLLAVLVGTVVGTQLGHLLFEYREAHRKHDE